MSAGSRVVLRNAYLKRVKFNYGRRKNPPSHNLEALLLAVRSSTTDWTDRHWPERPASGPEPDAGTRFMYFGDMKRRRTQSDGSGGGFYFTVGSYVYGQGEHQIAVDLRDPEPDINSGPMYDAKGQKRSILHEFRCVALGETLIVQNEQGGGGMPALALFLSNILRKHNPSLKLPNLVFMDVFANKLRKIIEQGGGVKSMQVRVIDGARPTGRATLAIATPLYDAKKAVANTGRLIVRWEADDDDGLDVDTVINTFTAGREVASDLDKVDLETMTGGPIRNIGKYKAKSVIPVTIDASGIEHKNEIKPLLYEYLDDLRTPDDEDWRLIDDEGLFLTGRVLSAED